jgi:hypothetical protein
VAVLAVALAEVLAARGDLAGALRYLDGVRASHSRHLAFRRELDAARTGSPLVPPREKN